MIRAYLAFTVFETKLFFREFIAVFFTLIVPAVIGVTVVLRRSPGRDVVSMFQDYMPSIVVVLAAVVAMFVLAGNLVVHRELGFFKRILAAPVGSDVIAASTATRGLIVIFAATVEMLLICLMFSGSLPSFNALEFALAIVLSCGPLFVLGFCIAAFVVKSSTMFVVSNVATQTLIFTSPVGLDWMGAPTALRQIAVVNPVTHAQRLLSLGWNGELLSAASIAPIVFLLVFTAAGLMLARRFFTWTT